jgi:protein-tyrosine phosphatase
MIHGKMRRIDVHSHLLPGVDDGCATLEQSIQCARMLVEAGYSHGFCTPHLWPSNPRINRQTVADWTRDLQRSLDNAGIPFEVLPGSELNLHPKVIQTPPDRIISLALGGKYILVDMWAERLPEWFDATICWLQGMQLTVILGHPERMRAVQECPELADHFAELGVLLQGNLQCFADRPDAHTRRTAERFIREGRYFVLGSDCHEPVGLKTRLVGLRNAVALVGDAVVDKLTCENPQALLPDGT